MSNSGLIKWGGASFALGGVVWMVLNSVTLGLDPTATPGPLPLLLYILALLLSNAGLVGFHVLQKESYGRLGRAGFYTILASSALLILGTLFFMAGAESVDGILSPVGLLGVVAGFVLFGVATIRARVLPVWCGVLFVVLLPVTVALGEYGNFFDGLGQLALGYALWSQGGAPAGRTARVT